jgi:L-ribulose-5-phosphate 3-epimerase
VKRVLSCYSNCFGSSGVWVAAERLRETGLDHLELALRSHNFGGLVIPESAVVTEKATEGEARSFVEHLQRHNVSVSGCNVGGANILTPEGLELTRRRIRFARKWFNAGVVVSGAGQPSNAEERALMIDHLRAIGDTAAELGVTVALETHKGPTQNADAMLALMAELSHPAVWLNFDTGNIAYYNAGADPVAELDKVKHLVRNVHLKDNRGRFEDWYFPAVGDGSAVDFRKIRETLDGVGFTGPYTIEIEGIQGEAEPGLEGRIERLARSFRHLEECGYTD